MIQKVDVQEKSSGQIQAAFPFVLVPLHILGFELVPEGIMLELSPLPLVPHQGTCHLGNTALPHYFRRLWASCQEAVLTFWWACCCVLWEKLERCT